MIIFILKNKFLDIKYFLDYSTFIRNSVHRIMFILSDVTKCRCQSRVFELVYFTKWFSMVSMTREKRRLIKETQRIQMTFLYNKQTSTHERNQQESYRIREREKNRSLLFCFICRCSCCGFTGHHQCLNTFFLFVRKAFRTFCNRFLIIRLTTTRLNNHISRKFSNKRFVCITFDTCQSEWTLDRLSIYTAFLDQPLFQLSRLFSGLSSIIRFANVAFSFDTRNNSFRRLSWLRLIGKKSKSRMFQSIFIIPFRFILITIIYATGCSHNLCHFL